MVRLFTGRAHVFAILVEKKYRLTKFRVSRGKKREMHAGERNHMSHRLTNERGERRRNQPLTHSDPVSTIHDSFPFGSKSNYRNAYLSW